MNFDVFIGRGEVTRVIWIYALEAGIASMVIHIHVLFALAAAWAWPVLLLLFIIILIHNIFLLLAYMLYDLSDRTCPG